MRKRNFEYFCDDFENIENYELAKADNFKGWVPHHRLGTHTSDGERRLVDISKKELIALGMYFHRPAEELIFLTVKEHSSLHHKGKPSHRKGKHHSEESRKKMSESLKGKEAWNKGTKGICKANSGSFKKGNTPWIKGRKHTEDARAKMSAKLKGRDAWNKGKSIPESQMLLMNEMKEAYRNNNPLNLKWNEFQKWYRREK